MNSWNPSTRAIGVVTTVLLFPLTATAGLIVSVVAAPPTGPGVKVRHQGFDTDKGGRTSVRFFTNDSRDEINTSINPKDPAPRRYYVRDRDLGQTFIPRGKPFRLDAITLRTGPADNAVGKGALGSPPVSLQFFAVSGDPVTHDNGTTTRASVGGNRDPRSDDFLTGETYTSLRVVSGGKLPGVLKKDQFLRWALTGDDAIVLQPDKKFAFLVMFDGPAPGREFALANNLFGTYPDGHGIRREGSIDRPFDNLEKVFNARSQNASDDRSASSLPLDRATRLGGQPGTWGRPDVDTHRDLTFYIEGTTVSGE